jgi:isopenicillin N synthase-like dioxygenase
VGPLAVTGILLVAFGLSASVLAQQLRDTCANPGNMEILPSDISSADVKKPKSIARQIRQLVAQIKATVSSLKRMLDAGFGVGKVKEMNRS